MGGIGRLSVTQFAMVRAAVSIWSQRAVAKTKTRVLQIQLRTRLVTVRAELLCFHLKRRPGKADFR